MAVKKNIQINSNLDKERYSNFVVDLRGAGRTPAALQSEAAAKQGNNNKNWSDKVKAPIMKIEKAAKKIKPNLLRRQKAERPAWHFDWSGWRRLVARPTGFSKIKPWRKYWQEAVAARAKIMSAVPRLQRSVTPTQRRAEKAERTVIWYRSLLSFVIVLILIILPIKLLSYWHPTGFSALAAKIMNQSQLALSNLASAADSVSKLDFKQADNDFQKAGANFLTAQNDLSSINDSLLALASLSSNPKIKLASESKKFLTAGVLASALGRDLVLATDSLFHGDKNDFNGTLNNFLINGHAAVSDARSLSQVVASIDPNALPDAYRSQFDSLNKQASLLADNLANFVDIGDKLQGILGLSRDKRYLLVFQNNSEMRASGGFLGSYALMDLGGGKIRNLEVPGGGSYDTEAGLMVHMIAPQPLWLVNPLWHFWDANWWPDWPTTAKKLMWFYAKSDGPSVDGVISVTPTVVERLLEITGPIDLTQDYGLTVDSNNFWDTVQTVVEAKNLVKDDSNSVAHLPTSTTPIATSTPLQAGLAASDNKPKKIIGDLMAKILETLPQKLTQDNLLKIMTMLNDDLSEKQVLFYFTDPTAEAAVTERNWGGEVRNTDKDYLLVVNTNIAGQKTDRVITEKIEQTSEVGADGVIIDTVKITRAHNGVKNTPLTGVRNVDWLRVYVPQGSTLVSADGFSQPDAKYFQTPDSSWQSDPTLATENAAVTDPATGVKIYSEDNKTVFADWSMVDPGETAVITFKYRLPFNFFSSPTDNSWQKSLNNLLNPGAADLLPYSLLVQKQPGAADDDFSSQLILPANLPIFWRYPDTLTGVNGWTVSEPLSGDKYWSVLVQSK